MNALVSELSLGSARGGRKPEAEVEWHVVRALEESDLAWLSAPPPLGSTPNPVKELRSAHHRLAQLLARGEEHNEVALITGYSISYISNLLRDPCFQELVHVYTKEREAIFVDLVEREKQLGETVLEELQARLAGEPEKWTKRELMELYDRLRPQQGLGKAGFGGGPAGPVSLQVNFVSPSHGVGAAVAGPILDLKPSDG